MKGLLIALTLTVLVASAVEAIRIEQRAYRPGGATTQQKTSPTTTRPSAGGANGRRGNGGSSNPPIGPLGNDMSIIGLPDGILEYFVNVYRSRHGVPPIKVDPKLKEKALACANSYALSKEMKGNDIENLSRVATMNPQICKDIGEDMEFPYTGGNYGTELVNILSKWYKEKDGGMCPPEKIPYNFATPNMTHKACHQHFTQLVWKETTSFACAVSTQTNTAVRDPDPKGGTPGDQYITVCIFSPAGNIVSSRNTGTFYLQNVFEAKDDA